MHFKTNMEVSKEQKQLIGLKVYEDLAYKCFCQQLDIQNCLDKYDNNFFCVGYETSDCKSFHDLVREIKKQTES